MIDVLIPAYNAERTVRSAIESILNQTYPNIRVIVVDDGSTDDTPDILRSMAAADDRLLVYRTDNGGIVAALNHGLQFSQADYIARHDADDIAYPERLSTQLQYLERNPDCIAVGANARHIDDAGNVLGRTHLRGDATGNNRSVPAYEPYLMHPLLLMRAWGMRAVGGYRYVLHAEDSDLYWRLAPLGRLHNMDDVLADYRIHTGSITSGSQINVRAGAVSSQLGAISARRRSAGSTDIAFDSDWAARIQQARELDAMIVVASEKITADEKRYLEIASAAKMTELRIYREFRFSRSDIQFIISQIIKHPSFLSLRDIRHLMMRPVHYAKPRVKARNLLQAVGLSALAAKL